MALPSELSADARAELVREWVSDELVSRGMVTDAPIHEPSRNGDERNHHAHVGIVSTRSRSHPSWNHRRPHPRPSWGATDPIETMENAEDDERQRGRTRGPGRHTPSSFRRSVPGIGEVLALTILYEICHITRFETVQQFASYRRLVKCQKSSAEKALGTSGAKIGNAYLKWAFSEAAVLFLAKCQQGNPLLARLERKHGKGNALSILAHKIGRAVSFMLSRRTAFDMERFLSP